MLALDGMIRDAETRRNCAYAPLCIFHTRRLASSDVQYRAYIKRYCEGTSGSCAIHQVIAAATFLAVPVDLYPNQTERVPGILRK